MTSSTKPEVNNVLHCQATTTVNMYRKLREVWTYGLWDMRADRQTDRHTVTIIALLRTPIESE